MRMLAFADRNRKEYLRDPLSLLFGIGFPVALILMISLMSQSMAGTAGMPKDIFGIEAFAPGMAVFGLSFLSMFLGMLMANDRGQSFLMRLFASPLKGTDYIVGYALPLVPLALCQGAVCFLTASLFGLQLNVRVFAALLALLPSALLFIALGLLMGSMLTYRQVGGVGSILVNAAAWLSGTWFSLDLIGGAFKAVCEALPFFHAVSLVKGALQADYSRFLPDLLWVLGYTALFFFVAVLLFRKKMKQ